MKNSRPIILAVVCLTAAFVLSAARPSPQDPIKVAPNHFKVLLENDRVRVLELRGKAGDKIDMHSHPAYVSYLVSGSGKTKFTSSDGKTTEVEAQVGKALWHDAETHAAELAGPAHSLLIELKK